jgi:hypothetical protein
MGPFSDLIFSLSFSCILPTQNAFQLMVLTVPLRNCQVLDKRTRPVAQKALRLAGSFAYRNPIVWYPDRPSREDSFANRDDPLIAGALTGSLTLIAELRQE